MFIYVYVYLYIYMYIFIYTYIYKYLYGRAFALTVFFCGLREFAALSAERACIHVYLIQAGRFTTSTAQNCCKAGEES